MSLNTFGHLFRVTTWGESHGPALGATVDGCPPGVPLEAAMIQHWLDRRKPGQNKYTTQRREADEVEILSGVFEGQTTGTPIQLMIRNTDQRSKDYRRYRREVSPRSRRYHLLAEIRHPRPARRRAVVGAGNRGAGGGGRRGARGDQGAGAGCPDHRIHGADGAARDRPGAVRRGRDRAQSVLGARCHGGGGLGRSIWTGCANRAVPWAR